MSTATPPITPPISDPQETIAPPIEKKRNLPAFLALMLALSVLLVLAVLIFSPFSAPIVVALIFTTLSQPLFSRILWVLGEKRRGLAAALTCGAIIMLVILPLVWIGWSMVKQAPQGKELLEDGLRNGIAWLDKKERVQKWKNNEVFRKYWDRIQAALGPPKEGTPKEGKGEEPSGQSTPPKQPEPSPPPVEPAGSEPPPPEGGGELKGLPALGLDVVSWTTKSLTFIMKNAMEIVLKFFLMLFILFYFLKDGPQLLRSLNRAVPLERKYQEKAVETFRQVTRSIIRGSFGTALAQGVVAALAFLPVGIPAIFWGVMVALSSLIPPVGTAIIMGPITVFVFLTKHWGWGVYMAVVTLLIGSLDNIVRPFLVGQTIRMHPIWLLLSILGGMAMFGAMGLIYGPLVLVLLATFFGIFLREEQDEAAKAQFAAQVVAGAPSKPTSGNGGKR